MMTGSQQSERFSRIFVMLSMLLFVNILSLVCTVAYFEAVVNYVEPVEQQCSATTQYYERAYPIPEPTETF